MNSLVAFNNFRYLNVSYAISLAGETQADVPVVVVVLASRAQSKLTTHGLFGGWLRRNLSRVRSETFQTFSSLLLNHALATIVATEV